MSPPTKSPFLKRAALNRRRVRTPRARRRLAAAQRRRRRIQLLEWHRPISVEAVAPMEHLAAAAAVDPVAVVVVAGWVADEAARR